MKKIIQNPIIKILIILSAIILINGILELNQVQAGILSDVGGKLISAILSLIMFVADLILQTMQHMMVGAWEIEDYNGNSTIQYSPGIIFLDKVAGLKVNFISASEDDKTENKNVLTNLGNGHEIQELAFIIKEKRTKLYIPLEGLLLL